MQTIHKTYISLFINLILIYLRNEKFVFQSLHIPYIEAFKTLHKTTRKPYTNASTNPTQNEAQTLHEREHKPYTKRRENLTQNEAKTLHCNGTQFYLGAHLGKTRSAPKKN